MHELKYIVNEAVSEVINSVIAKEERLKQSANYQRYEIASLRSQ
jgi:uncharacterized protein YlzI (FlbEa/FlbD family)